MSHAAQLLAKLLTVSIFEGSDEIQAAPGGAQAGPHEPLEPLGRAPWAKNQNAMNVLPKIPDFADI